MNGPSSFAIAQTLESAGYWALVLPHEWHQRLQSHLRSAEAWSNFFTAAPPSSEASPAARSPARDKGDAAATTSAGKAHEPGADSDNEVDIQDLVQRRQKQLGVDGLLSLRIRVLLLDASLSRMLGGQPLYLTSVQNARPGHASVSPHDCLNDMYYTLECDRDDWALASEGKSVADLFAFRESGEDVSAIAHLLGSAAQARSGDDTGDAGGSPYSSPNQRRTSSRRQRGQSVNSSRELRNLLSDVKTTKSWVNPEVEGFEELYTGLDRVLTLLKGYEEHSFPFLQRVRKQDAPDYYDVIKHPMDLGQMGRKIKRREYNSKREFQADLDLMFANCRQYNTDPKSIYVHHAAMLEKYSKKLLRQVRSVTCVPVSEKKEQPAQQHSTASSPNSLSGQETEHSDTEEPAPPPATDTPPRDESQSVSPLMALIRREKESEGADSVASSEAKHPLSMHNEDLQVFRWREYSLQRRLARVRDSYIRSELPFSEWNAIERSPQDMAEYLQHYDHLHRHDFHSPSSTGGEGPSPLDSLRYLPEYHLASSIPELPVTAPAPPSSLVEVESNQPTGRLQSRGFHREMLLAVQQSLVMLLAQRGFVSTHRVPFEVLLDLYISTLGEFARTVQWNALSDPVEMVGLLMKQVPKMSLQGLRQFMSESDASQREVLRHSILTDARYEVTPASPSEEDLVEVERSGRVIPLSHAAYSSQTSGDLRASLTQEEPSRKRMKVSESPRGRKREGGRRKSSHK